MRRLLCRALAGPLLLALCVAAAESAERSDKVIKAGIIGLDTSHSVAFTELLAASKPGDKLFG